MTRPRLKCNERLHSFGSLHDGSYLGIGKDATIDVVWCRPFPFREAKSPWVEWLQCSCSLMCSCSDKHRVLSHDRWLSNRVLAKECHRVMHILPECVHSAELYWEPSISKKKRTSVVAWVVLLPSIVSSYCHYCQLQPVQTHKWKCLMVILPQLYHCWQLSHLPC